jgi:hypothetical protein
MYLSPNQIQFQGVLICLINFWMKHISIFNSGFYATRDIANFDFGILGIVVKIS